MNQPTGKPGKNSEDSSIDEGLQDFIAQYRQAYPRLTTIAAAIAGDQIQAEDIVQEAAIIALEKLDEFQSGSNLVAWLAEIVRRCALNYRRKTQNRKTYAADPASLVQLAQSSTLSESASSESASPVAEQTGDLSADQSEFDDEMIIALGRLSHDARSCLLLRTIHKLSYTEIAEIMQIPEGTAMSHVHRSKNELRNRLRPHVYGTAPLPANPK